MEGRYDALLAVGYKDRNAIGGLHGEQQAGGVGDEAVALAGLGGPFPGVGRWFAQAG